MRFHRDYIMNLGCEHDLLIIMRFDFFRTSAQLLRDYAVAMEIVIFEFVCQQKKHVYS
jgi:hypothetical protein